MVWGCGSELGKPSLRRQQVSGPGAQEGFGPVKIGV